ncbi:hypothetical protein KKH56_02325, partial [bacterium]|nr:hypothetical protein [bacterium]
RRQMTELSKEMLQEQVERRRQRGIEGLVKIVNQGQNPVYSTFEVTSVLTGTPLENRLDELFSVLQFIDPTILGPLWRFNQRYYEVNRRPSGSYKVLGYKNLDELRHRIAPYVLRRLKDQVQLDLLERIDSNFFVEMTEPQRAAYGEYEHKRVYKW